MNLEEAFDGLSCLSLALRHPSQLKRYISFCLKKYDELAEKGLPPRGPVTPSEDMTVTIPAYHSGGGMSFVELMVLARTTKVLKPKTIFEIGSNDGLTTALFILNSEAEAKVWTLDIPPAGAEQTLPLSSDEKLIASRRLLSVPQSLGLSRYMTILCDSIQFDPSPCRFGAVGPDRCGSRFASRSERYSQDGKYDDQ